MQVGKDQRQLLLDVPVKYSITRRPRDHVARSRDDAQDFLRETEHLGLADRLAFLDQAGISADHPVRPFRRFVHAPIGSVCGGVLRFDRCQGGHASVTGTPRDSEQTKG